MTREQWLVAAMAVVAALAVLALLFATARRRRARARPNWERMERDHDYFRRVLQRLFRERGYQVRGYRVFQDPLEEEAREILFSLYQDGTLYAALCVRWIVPVTSEVIGRFDQALKTTRADLGMIVTTSIYTEGALERARGLPLELYDRDHLHKWIAQVWP